MQPVSLLDLKGVGKRTFETLKEAGVETLEDLKLVGMSQLGRSTGLPETCLREILLRAELQAYAVPPDVADALVASGAIARVGELAAFDTDALQALLAQAAKPGEALDLSAEAIDALASVPRLSLDEESTQGLLVEGGAAALHDEAEPALQAEEPVISKREVEAIAAGLERTFHQFVGKVQAGVTAQEETIELANAQALLSSLQADIQTALAQLQGQVEPGLGVALGEDEAPAFAEEEITLDAEIQVLSQRLATTQRQLEEVQIKHVAASEEQSPAAQEEEAPTALRGE